MSRPRPVRDIRIRRGRPEDATAVLRLWKRAEVVPGRTDDAQALTALLRARRDALLVAERDGAIVGSVIAAWDGWRGGIYRLAVAPEARRLGLARTLVGEAEHRLRSHGARRMSVLVVADDPRARPFWESMQAAGYVPDLSMVRYVKMLSRPRTGKRAAPRTAAASARRTRPHATLEPPR